MIAGIVHGGDIEGTVGRRSPRVAQGVLHVRVMRAVLLPGKPLMQRVMIGVVHRHHGLQDVPGVAVEGTY